MEIKTGISLLSILFTIPTVHLALKARFADNFELQCIDLLKKENRDYKKDITFRYRLFASHFYKIKMDSDSEWLQVFGNSTSDIKKRIKHDKSDAIRSWFWFALFVVSAIISVLL